MRSAFVESSFLPFLSSAQNEDGGWGFHAGAMSRAEPTAWALIALLECASTPAHEEAASRAVRFLLAAQLPDGSWASTPESREGCWATSLVCLALHGRNDSSASAMRGLDWLSKELPGDASLFQRLLRRLRLKKSISNQNPLYFGWSWTAGTASWVEPTSCAILSFRAAPAQSLSADAQRRLRMGETMLYDRMCPSGGWNSGNLIVYGGAGEPLVSPTVWALLALQEHPERPEVHKSIQWLESNWQSILGHGSLALALLALHAYGRPGAGLAGPLQARYESNETPWSVPEVAWAALALSGAQDWWKPKSNGKDR
jgi:hypothetical protein